MDTTMKELTLTISIVDLEILLSEMKANKSNEICDTATIDIKYDTDWESYKMKRGRNVGTQHSYYAECNGLQIDL